MAKSDFPFGSEFSPKQIDLRELLEIVHDHPGQKDRIEEAIFSRYFARRKTKEKRKLAYNCYLSMKSYGLIDDTAHFTELGQKLYNVREQPDKLYEEFVKHILLNLKGQVLLDCIWELEQAGEKIDLQRIRECLRRRGLHVSHNDRSVPVLVSWLRKVGILPPKSWEIDEERLKRIAGYSVDLFDSLASLSEPQKAFLRALANLSMATPGNTGPFVWSKVAKLASATYGVDFPEGKVPSEVLRPLEEKGFIRLNPSEKTKGRGGKPYHVYPGERFKEEVVLPLLRQIEEQIRPALHPFLRQPIDKILAQIQSKDRHIAGLALEALAFKLMRLIDLEYVTTRLRGDQTGGAEVDLIFESSRLVFTRWQVQCKNTKSVHLDDVAKEVGLAISLLKSNVVVVITTGEIGREARKYSRKVMKETNLAIVLVNGKDIKKIIKDPTEFIQVLNREARHAMKIKRIEGL